MTREPKRRVPDKANRWHRKGAVLITLALLGSLPAFASERQVIPFEINQHDHMVVRLEVNETDRVTGIIDTAATFPMINGRTARLADIPELGENPAMVRVLGLTGAEVFPVVQLDRLVVGNVMKTDVPVALNVDLNVTGAQNVLPASAFEGDVIDFDFENQRVMVYDGRPDRSARLVPSSMRYETINGLPFVEVRINGRKGRALIDTGSSITYVNSRFAADSHTTPNEEKTQVLQGATGADQSLSIATAKMIAIGDYRLTRVDILVSDPPLFEYLGMEDEPAMVLGLDLLSVFRMQMDRRRSKLILSLPGSATYMRGVNLDARDSHIPNF